jgi:biotin synthase-related radical SAM superfamily protein
VALTTEGTLERDGEVIATGVQLEPVMAHCPEQVYTTVVPGCIHKCAFCALAGHVAAARSEEIIISRIEHVFKASTVVPVALTSGVSPDGSELDRCLSIVKRLKNKWRVVPIGVSVCIKGKEDLERLLEVGCDEIKINLEVADPDILRKVCPQKDRDAIIALMKEAVELFGRGRVCSNIILGLGESDQAVLDTMDELAAIGVVANLRPLEVTLAVEPALERALGVGSFARPQADRLIRLVEAQCEILARHRLSASGMDTMCSACTGCDLAPGHDL